MLSRFWVSASFVSVLSVCVSFLKEEEDCEERIRKKREKEIDRERDEGKEKRMREKQRERGRYFQAVWPVF